MRIKYNYIEPLVNIFATICRDGKDLPATAKLEAINISKYLQFAKAEWLRKKEAIVNKYKKVDSKGNPKTAHRLVNGVKTLVWDFGEDQYNFENEIGALLGMDSSFESVDLGITSLSIASVPITPREINTLIHTGYIKEEVVLNARNQKK